MKNLLYYDIKQSIVCSLEYFKKKIYDKKTYLCLNKFIKDTEKTNSLKLREKNSFYDTFF